MSHLLTRRARVLAPLWVVACLVLCGCRLDAELAVAVDRDGGGDLRLTLVADADAVARADAAGADPLELVADAAGGLAARGWDTATATTAEGGREVSVTVDFADPAELHSLTAELAEALAAPELRPLEPLSVTVTDDRVRVDGAAALRPSEGVAELGLTPAQAEELLADAVSYAVRIDLPGDTIEATADRATADGVLVWDVAAGEREVVSAVGERPPPAWLAPAVGALATGAALALGTGAALLAARRRRHRDAR